MLLPGLGLWILPPLLADDHPCARTVALTPFGASLLGLADAGKASAVRGKELI